MRLSLTTCYALLQLCSIVASQRTILDSFVNLQLLRGVRLWINQNFGSRSTEGARYLGHARDQNKLQVPVPEDVPFPCDVKGGRSPQVPTSVHKLRPGDIDVIAAMGDSLTAGAGILSTRIEQVPIENRGLSAIGGGQGTWRQYLTLPNIFKEFNPRLIGYAYGDSLSIEEASQLNVAESGAMSRDMPYMAETLVKKIKRDPRIDLQKHWKFITLSIGANDFCSNICYHDSPWSILEEHKMDIVKTLRILRDNLPRTFVSLALPSHLRALVATNPERRSFFCYASTIFECPCLFGLKYRSRREEYYRIISKWQDMEEEIANYPEFQTKDFAVVAQPCLRNVAIPLGPDGESDPSYLAADCFHVAQKTDALFANCQWNNLLESVNRKSTNWTPLFEKFLCPTDNRPYLATGVNSVK